MKRLMITLALAASGCSDAKGAREAAEAMGLTDVKVGGYAFIGCGKEDDTATKFEATNMHGDHVYGVVCGGLFGKGQTLCITGVKKRLPASPVPIGGGS